MSADRPTNGDTWREIERIFLAALSRPEDERPAFLADACAERPHLVPEIEAMLDAHERDRGLAMERFLVDDSDTPAGVNGDPTSLDPDAMIGTRVGPYQLTDLIGRGGMGDVYRAERVDDQYHQAVALKLVRPGYRAAELAARFRQERQILARLVHPHIATLLDGGVATDGRPYLVMEHVEGVPITDYCDTHGLSVRDRLALFRTVCAAVAFAHANLIVHRDLKPANILVTPDGRVKLLDFGIAKLLDADATDTHTRPAERLLTPEHAAPEQVRGETITTSTDVYGLGVLLYELLTGAKPFGAENASGRELERLICEVDPTAPGEMVRRGPPARHGQGIGRELDKITLMALRKEPERRYRSAEQLEEDVERYLTGHAIVAERDTFGYRTRKFIQRNRAAILLACSVLLLVVGSAIVSMMQSRRTARERDRAEAERARAEEVLELMVGLFQTSNPEVEPGGDTLRVSTFLTRSEAQINAIGDQPEVQARVWEVFANIHLARTHYRQARSFYERSLAAHHAAGTEESIDAARVQHQLAEVVWWEEGPLAAEPLLRASLERYRALRGEDHPDVAEAMQDLASVTPDSAEAERLLDASLAMRRESSPFDDVGLAAALNARALRDLDQGRPVQAAERLEEALTILETDHPDDHPSVLTVTLNLASVYGQLGEWARGEALQRRVLERRRLVLGDGSVGVGVALEGLGTTLVNQRRYDEGLALFQNALDIFEKELPVDHWRIISGRRNVACVLAYQGRYEEALPMLEGALAAADDAFGAASAPAAVMRGQLATILPAVGRAQEAVDVARSACEVLEGLDPAEPSKLATARMALGLALLETGDAASSEALLRSVVVERGAMLPESHPYHAAARSALGAALVALNREDEAEPLLRAGIPVIEAWGQSGEVLLTASRRALAIIDRTALDGRASTSGAGQR